MMKKSIFVVMSILISAVVFAQPQQQQQPVFKVGAVIPRFNFRNIIDSVPYSNANLEKNKKTIFIYFGPDCGHCINFTKKLTDSISLVNNTQIVMVSSSEFSHMKKFYDDNNLSNFQNISMARDADYFFITYYSVRQFPAAYIYNSKGKFVKSFESEFSIAELAETN